MNASTTVTLSLANLVTKAARVVGQHYQKECAPLGVTGPQAGIIWMLSRVGPKTQVELARLLHLEKTNVNTMVKKLVDGELIALKKVPEDARKTEIVLTPKGKRLSKKLTDVDERVNDQFAALVTKDTDEAVIRAFLEKIVFAETS